jgi:hypothetical protein
MVIDHDRFPSYGWHLWILCSIDVHAIV